MIIAFAGQKGGSGKSTLATNVASELHRRGSSVLLVDADPQGTTQTWANLAATRGLPMPTVISMNEALHKSDQLPKLSRTFDWTLVDCPGRLDRIQRSAFAIADILILPCSSSAAHTWALGRTLEDLNEVRSLRPELRAYIVINAKRPNTVLGRALRSTLEQSGLDLFETEICLRQVFEDALAAGAGVSQYAPKDNAAFEIRRLVDEIVRLSAFTPMKKAGGM